MSRIFFALNQNPKGLSLAQICEITGLKPSNVVTHGIRNFFKYQILEEINGTEEIVYRLIPIKTEG